MLIHADRARPNTCYWISSSQKLTAKQLQLCDELMNVQFSSTVFLWWRHFHSSIAKFFRTSSSISHLNVKLIRV